MAEDLGGRTGGKGDSSNYNLSMPKKTVNKAALILVVFFVILAIVANT